MPPNVPIASPLSTMPASLCLQYTRKRSFEVWINEYPNGDYCANALTDVSRKEWTITKRLTSASGDLLEQFFDSVRGSQEPFYYYDAIEYPLTSAPPATYWVGTSTFYWDASSVAGVQRVILYACGPGGITDSPDLFAESGGTTGQAVATWIQLNDVVSMQDSSDGKNPLDPANTIDSITSLQTALAPVSENYLYSPKRMIWMSPSPAPLHQVVVNVGGAIATPQNTTGLYVARFKTSKLQRTYRAGREDHQFDLIEVY